MVFFPKAAGGLTRYFSLGRCSNTLRAINAQTATSPNCTAAQIAGTLRPGTNGAKEASSASWFRFTSSNFTARRFAADDVVGLSAAGSGGLQARTKCPCPARRPRLPEVPRQSDIATGQNQTKGPNRDRSRRTFHGRPWNLTGQLLLGCARTNCPGCHQNGWDGRLRSFLDRRSGTS